MAKAWKGGGWIFQPVGAGLGGGNITLRQDEFLRRNGAEKKGGKLWLMKNK